MRRGRYQPPESANPDEEQLPLDTVCTVLTRQSTVAQGKRNLFSAEVNPDELVREARRLGFTDERIQVLDWDMGIGAYNTTIEERPALRHWLHELLPSEQSRVVLVSQEDRLFRDRTEIQVNTFIEQVAQHRGWVICGSRIYNLRRDMDKEQFRFACKAGKYFIDYHLKGRLLPARHRAALSGRHVGGPVPWGYVVDYDPRSPMHMHYVCYEPHAMLVVEYIFKAFAQMPNPSQTAVARAWRREGRVFPFFAPDVDTRRVRWVEAHCTRDDALGGYVVHPDMVQRILTDVAYLGWRVRRGELALDEHRQPKVCHKPLVDPELFWWCFDALLPSRPQGAPPRPSTSRTLLSSYRPRLARTGKPAETLFLAPGRIRCVVHGTRYAPARKSTGVTRLLCGSQARELVERGEDCPVVIASTVEHALCSAFVEVLTLDDRDIHNMARVAHEQESSGGHILVQLRQQLNEQRTLYERAKRRALLVDDDQVAAEVLVEASKARQAVGELELRIAEYRERDTPTAQAWQRAERAARLAECIRQTFPDWPREYQEPVLSLALAEAVLGHVNRRVLGLWMRWRGGVESRHEIARAQGQRLEWTPEEDKALREWYDQLIWDALCAMLPSRTRQSIEKRASHLGLTREKGGASLGMPPVVVPGPPVANTMAAYGFPLGTVTLKESVSAGTP
jgi:hypothetical protein